MRPAACLLVWMLGSLACVSAPRPEDWMAVGWRSPRQCFESFKTALAGDRPQIEYRCLSSAFKQREGLVALGWLEARERLLREQPWLVLAATAEVTAERPLAADRVELLAVISRWWMSDTKLRVELVREDFYELWEREALLLDGSYPWESFTHVVPEGLEVSTRFPNLGSEVSEVRLGREWKIDRIELVEDL